MVTSDTQHETSKTWNRGTLFETQYNMQMSLILVMMDYFYTHKRRG